MYDQEWSCEVKGIPCMSARDLFEVLDAIGCADLPLKFGSSESLCNVIVAVDIVSPAYTGTNVADLEYEPAV